MNLCCSRAPSLMRKLLFIVSNLRQGPGKAEYIFERREICRKSRQKQGLRQNICIVIFNLTKPKTLSIISICGFSLNPKSFVSNFVILRVLAEDKVGLI